MKKNRFLFLMGILLFINSFTVKAQQYTVTPILQNGNPESTYNLVVVAEAYTEQQLGDFLKKAQLVDDVLAMNPLYKSLLNRMNIYAISTPSVDGEISLIANNPSSFDPIQTSTPKNTFFNIYYQNSYRAYFLDDSTMIKARKVAAEYVPYVDNVLILVNASQGQYISGRASSFQKVAVTGVNDFSTTWEQYALIHELSHSLGGLSDEYSDTPDEGFNVTTNNNPLTIRWKDYLSNPEAGIVSVNQGIYIPNKDCLMNAFGTSYFCPVCTSRIRNVLQTSRLQKLLNVHRIQLESEDVNNSIFKFSWDPIPGATHYEVIYIKANFSPYSLTPYSQITNTNEVTFDLPGSSESLSYHDLKIRAFNANSSSYFYPHQFRFKIYDTPVTFQVPRNITVTERTRTSFKLQWNSEAASKGSLIRLWNGEEAVSEILTDERSITFNNLTPGANYKVQIAAVKPNDIALNNSSPFSEKINVDLSLSSGEINAQNKITLYPNPATTTIQFSNLKNVENYKIYNMNSQEIKTGKVSKDNNKIDVRDLTNGVYFIRLNNNEFFKFIKK